MTGVAQFHMTFANNTAVRQLLGDHPTASRQLDHPRWTWESGPWGGGLNEPWNDIVDRASVPAKSTLLAGAEAQKSRIIKLAESPDMVCHPSRNQLSLQSPSPWHLPPEPASSNGSEWSHRSVKTANDCPVFPRAQSSLKPCEMEHVACSAIRPLLIHTERGRDKSKRCITAH